MKSKVVIKPLALAVALIAQLSHGSPITELPATATEASTSSSIPVINHQTTRTYDGSFNNLQHPEYGRTNIQLLRLPGLAPLYGDGISEPVGHRINARAISNFVFVQTESIPEPQNATQYLWAWGQFIDHDLDLTPENHDEELLILNPHDPDGIVQLDLDRSTATPGTGTSIENPRQQSNIITGWMDGSMVYGSSAATAQRLRSFSSGKLKVNENFTDNGRSFLPQEGTTMSSHFFAGDVRVNEHIILSSMHTLFLREHNRHADAYIANHPEAEDEEIYQHCRKMVIAIIQNITFTEFLPLLLGQSAIPAYSGYDAAVRPDISNSFATAAYRFGHSAVKSTIPRLNADGTTHIAGDLTLSRQFSSPETLTNPVNGGLDPIFRGLGSERTEKVDSKVINDLRNQLFGVGDLVARNIARGRDHGLRPLNDVRKAFNLRPYERFEEVNEDPAVQNQLRSACNGDINELELFFGGLAERRESGALLGATFSAVLKDQFTRTRDGDRMWYQNMDNQTNPAHLTPAELVEIESTTLSKVIARNTGITSSELADNAFIIPEAQARTGDNEEVQFLLSRVAHLKDLRDKDVKKNLDRQEDLTLLDLQIYVNHVIRQNKIRKNDFDDDNENIDNLLGRIRSGRQR